jgi:hypothetical protein
MFRNLVILISLTFFIACNNQTTENKLADDQSETQAAGYYGEKITGENPISGDQLVSMLADKDSVYVTMKATIVSNCQKSGCWMDLDLGSDELAKVTFKDYAFVIPLDSKGKTATVEGVAKREIIPVDLLKHYAEDEGKSQEEIDAITQDEIAYTFEAVGVIIED